MGKKRDGFMSSKIKDLQQRTTSTNTSMSVNEKKIARQNDAKIVQDQFDSTFREIVNFGGKSLIGRDKQEAKKKESKRETKKQYHSGN